MAKILDVIERVGNKIPHAAIVFVWMIAAVSVLSHICYLLGLSATYQSINSTSVVLLTLVCGFITDKYIEPRLGPYRPPQELQAAEAEAAPLRNRGLEICHLGTFRHAPFFACYY